MAKKLDKEKAIKLRLEGWSHSQIKKEIKVSKSTLSKWLHDFPLSEERIRALRDNSQIRIEKCRTTKEFNKKKRLDKIYLDVEKEIGELSEREIKLCGIFLYWGEGTKVASGSVVISNTDPAMVKFFLNFLLSIPISKERIFVRLQLYKDMDIEKEIRFWSDLLDIPNKNFKKPYIKKSNFIDITYKSGFGHGTCSLMIYDMNLYNKIILSIKYIKDCTLLRKT
jgi:transcriptional regulator with XRE-family HTH domain